jgi:hypothetical protein
MLYLQNSGLFGLDMLKNDFVRVEIPKILFVVTDSSTLVLLLPVYVLLEGCRIVPPLVVQRVEQMFRGLIGATGRFKQSSRDDWSSEDVLLPQVNPFFELVMVGVGLLAVRFEEFALL